MKNFLKKLNQLKHNEIGIALLEFSIAAPLLLLLIMCIVEVCRFVQFNQKLDDTTEQVVNIVNQNLNLSLHNTSLVNEAIVEMMLPFNAQDEAMIITAIQQNQNAPAQPDILWQVKQGKDQELVVSDIAPVIPNSSINNGRTSITVTCDPVTKICSKADIPGLTLTKYSQIILVEIYIKYKPLAFHPYGFGDNYSYKFAMARPRYGAFQFAPR